jgi:hypothetical protein
MFENDYIRVLEHWLQPGEAVAPSLPGDCLIVPLTSASLRINGAGARSLGAFEVVAVDGGVEFLESAGADEARLLLAHLKGSGPVEPPLVASDNAMLVEPDAYRLVFENRRARVARVTSAPGDTTIMHSHPPHVFRYMLAPNTLRITGADGAVRDVDIPAGLAFWREDADRHETVNIGETTGLLVLIEVR